MKQALYWEEDFLIKYSDDSITELLKTLPEDKFKKIKLLLDENLADTSKHKNMTAYLLENLKNGKY